MKFNFDKFIQKGYVPIQKTEDSTILKSKKGIIIVNDDNSAEGFLKGHAANNLKEGRIKNAIPLIMLIASGTTYFNTDITIVVGDSMSPTYESGKILIRSKAAKNVKDMLDRNAIIRFQSPDGNTCIKRIVGLPGDRIVIDGSYVYINGKLIDTENAVGSLDQQRNFHNPKYHNPDITLKPNEVYVMGDNRRYSTDSREYGPIPKSSILAVIDK